MHQVTGIALFVALLFLLAMLQMSLKSGRPALRRSAASSGATSSARWKLIGLLFALIYHMVAGFRHLIQDANKWLDLATARSTAFASLAYSASC